MKKTKTKNENVRPPIVVVLGHVDHGKSSLLEAIRDEFKITAKESGGITQHIGAYEAVYHDKKITFIDTPGHALFSQMRSRGAKAADIAMLVVAADESVKPQTIEAIEQIREAKIPMVVAINKIDKSEANVSRVKQELSEQGVHVESYGGDVPSVETSATTKQGIEELLEMILLVAELENPQGERAKPGEGVIVEAYIDSKRGPTVTLLVTNGMMHIGDFVATLSSSGKVRNLEDFQGQAVQEVIPSMPGLMIGFTEIPQVGEEFHVFDDEASASQFAKAHKKFPSSVKNSQVKALDIIVKADVSGSLEALENVLRHLEQDEVEVRIVRGGVGDIGEDDVKLARSTGAAIFGFHTKTNAAAADLAEKEGIKIDTYEVIYELIEKVKELMESSKEEEVGGREDLGSLHVLGVFLIHKNRQVIGGKVQDGEVKKGNQAEIVRQGEVVGKGRITNVQREKKDVPVASKGQECGLSYEGSEKIQEGDTLQFFHER